MGFNAHATKLAKHMVAWGHGKTIINLNYCIL